MQEEKWLPVVGFEGYYEVSDQGRVKSLHRNKEMIISFHIGKKGYPTVGLRMNKYSKTEFIHKLVAMAFLNHKPCGYKLVIDHINNVRHDNRLENLQIVTHRFNSHKAQIGYSSQYKGVCWVKRESKWRAQINIKGKIHRLGSFTDEYEAHLAYQKAVQEVEKDIKY